jgi:hypothetical protein
LWRFAWSLTFFALALTLLTACGSDVPPLAELPLRDALRAAPEVVAMLPEDQRLRLAARFWEGHALGGGAESIALANVNTPGGELRRVDGVREARDEDALVLARLTPSPGAVLVEVLSVEDVEERPPEPLELEGPAPAWTEPMEIAALGGRAGAVVRSLADHFDAHRFVRVTSWPAAVVVRDGSVFVNASWLVALSPTRPVGAATAEGPPPPPNSAAESPTSEPPHAPELQPQGLDYNPYHLPRSLSECAQAVDADCACLASNSCDGEPVASSFTSLEEECAWVQEDPSHGDALCALALMSIGALSDCVQSGTSCGLTANTLEEAVAFVAEEGCILELNSCLDNGEPTDPGGSGCSDDDDDSVCDDCTKSCWNNACNCDSCKCKDRKATAGRGNSADHDRSCRVASRPARLLRHGYVAWLLGPLCFLLFFMRRRP